MTVNVDLDFEDLFYNLRTDEQREFIENHLDELDDDAIEAEARRRGLIAEENDE